MNEIYMISFVYYNLFINKALYYCWKIFFFLRFTIELFAKWNIKPLTVV